MASSVLFYCQKSTTPAGQCILDFKGQKEDGGEGVGKILISYSLLSVFLSTFSIAIDRNMLGQGSKASGTIIEGLSDKLSDSIIKGQTSIGDWSPEKGAKIQVEFIITCIAIYVLISLREVDV